MGGHGHGETYKVPHHCEYDISKCPELFGVQQALAAKGLRDPWLRNEAWRFNESEFLNHGKRFRGFFFRGMLLGAAACAVTIVVEKIFFRGHGHEHDFDEC